LAWKAAERYLVKLAIGARVSRQAVKLSNR
jgi:hypothetical protein